MMMRYEKYKHSGAKWLGKIPEGWKVKKLGAILTEFSEKNHANKPLLSITREKGVILRDIDDDSENHNFIPEDLSGYKLLKKGQFGMNKMKAWQGSYGISDFDGIVSPAYFVFDITNDFSPAYFHKAIRSKFYLAHFASASDGVRIGQWDLSKNRMKEIPFLVPSLSEQQAIAEFLDDKTAKIDQLIAIKEKEINLLKERRQILIQKAVTKGLDPNVKLKDSGVDWIGEIPEHWEVLPGLKVYKENKTNNIGMKEEVVLSLSYGDIVIKPKEKLVGLVPESFETYQLVKPGDIIIRCMDLQNDKVSLRTGISLNHGIITNAYLNLNIINNNNSDYFYNFLYTLDTTKVIYKLGTGLRQNLSYKDFKRLPVIVPTTHEQKQIVNFIGQLKLKIGSAISLKQQEIEKLKEYKTILIDNVVTGKIKVS